VVSARFCGEAVSRAVSATAFRHPACGVVTARASHYYAQMDKEVCMNRYRRFAAAIVLAALPLLWNLPAAVPQGQSDHTAAVSYVTQDGHWAWSWGFGVVGGAVCLSAGIFTTPAGSVACFISLSA
jgi:hypothetical protein